MSVTTHLTFKDIENAVSTLVSLVNDLESEGKLNKEKIYKDFNAVEVMKEPFT